MKTLSQHHWSPLHFFTHNKRITRNFSRFLALALLHLTTGCTYYKVKEVPVTLQNMAPQIEAFNAANKFAIINQLWHLEDMTINEDDQTLTGTIQFLGEAHMSDKIREKNKTYMIKRNQEPLNEVHFIVDFAHRPEAGAMIIIPFKDIKGITINDKNTGRAIINVVGTTVGVLFVGVLIWAATKSSCPFVYIKDGDSYVFKGELYPGILTSNMQRFDYLPLPDFNPVDDRYEIKVTNELMEVQNTDFLELWVVEHAKGTQVFLDKHGKLHSTAEETLPIRATDGDHHNVLAALQYKDDIFHSFGEDLPSTTSTRQVDIEFDVPLGQNHAKLLLSAKNSMWLDYVFGKFNAQFGAYYPQFQKDQQSIPAAKSEQWLKEQHIPLSVYLKMDQGWELVEQINTVGPLATRDIVVPIDLGKISGDKVVVRLESGFMFWDLDYASLDFSENGPLQLTKIAPDLAIDENNNDLTSLLQKADGAYFTQAEIGNEVIVDFMAPKENPELERSVFLVNKGYYTYIRNYEGIPNFTRLKSFREADTFTRYSENAYKAIMALGEPVNNAL